MAVISKERLYHFSRNRNFLARWAVLLFTLTAVVGLLLGWFRPKDKSLIAAAAEEYATGVEKLPAGATARQALDWLRKSLQRERPEHWFRGTVPERDPNDYGLPLPKDHERDEDSEEQKEFQKWLAERVRMEAEARENYDRVQARLPESSRNALKLFEKIHVSEEANAPALLSELRAIKELDSSLSDSIEGEIFSKTKDFAKALEAFTKAAQAPDAKLDRERAIEICLGHDWNDKFRALWGRPGWREEASGWDREVREGALLKAGDYMGLLGMQVESSVHSLARHPWLSLLTLGVALIWYIVIHQVCALHLRTSWRGAMGFCLGLLSPSVTLVFLIFQEKVVGLEQNGQVVNDLIFFVSGVGLREEISKLLLFVPMLPLLWRRTQTEAFVVASCVGLGFAAEENLLYYGLTGGSAVPRFASANFMHLALTGLCGLALFRALHWPKRSLDMALATFVGVVLVHGIYDFLLSADLYFPRSGVSWFALVLLALLAVRYFDTVISLAEPRRQVVAPLAVFLTGAILIFSVGFWISCWNMGFKPAFDTSVVAAISSATLIAIFTWRLQEHH